MQDLSAKLAHLKKLDPTSTAFGAHMHDYRLAPPLLRSELDAACAAYSVMLPEDYRTFLLEVGAGGGGPGYGLQRFGYVADIADVPKAAKEGPLRTVVKTRNMEIQRPILYDAEGVELDPFTVSFWSSITRYAPNGKVGPSVLSRPFPFEAALYEGYDAPKGWDDGSFVLADYGCGIEARLVLNGEFSGHIWVSTLEGSMMPFALCAELHFDGEAAENIDREGRFSFEQWYRHWVGARLLERVPGSVASTAGAQRP